MDKESTVFGNYIRAISFNEEGASRLSILPDVIHQRHEIFELLLGHNAIPNASFLKQCIYSAGFKPCEGVAAWGHLAMAMLKLNTSRGTSQAYLDILKLVFRNGADPNLLFDAVCQETIWKSFLRAMYVAKSDRRDIGTEGRMRLQYEMTKCFLLHGADFDIYLDFPSNYLG